MSSQLSARAKTSVAAVAAVVMAGVTAYQLATRGGHFTWWDLIPILAAVLGVATTDHVDNTISSPAAKAVVHGALSALAAVTATLAVVVGSEPSGVSLAKLAVAGLGTLAVWAYPEAGPVVKIIEGEIASGAPVSQVLQTVAGDVSPLMGDPPTVSVAVATPSATSAPAVTPRQVDGVPSSAWSLRPVAAGSTTSPVPVASASEPTPVAAQAAALLTDTQPFPAVTAAAPTPVVTA